MVGWLRVRLLPMPIEPTRILKRSLNEPVFNALRALGHDPLVAKIIAGRPLPTHEKQALGVASGQLADLDSPFLLRDMDLAAARLRHALLHQEVIAVETDHDCDGQTSHAVIITALLQIFGHPLEKIQSYIGHRLQEGYGLSDALCERILAANPRPMLVITADNGSADEPRIARLKAVGIDVIVTDHHAIPAEGIPASAFVCLNPTRPDCTFPDPCIAGCMVAWLFMAATRRLMIDQGDVAASIMPMTELLDFVAVGTVADCVSLARSLNNRVVVQYGLKRINQFARPCWQALRPLLRHEQVTSEDLGFLIGPLLNSDGRLSDALSSVNFLLTESLGQATELAQALFAQNEERKRIQKEISKEAEAIAKNQVLAGRVSLVIYLVDGHAGVHGISASRIKDAWGRPVVIFSPKQNEPGILTGSCRSIDVLNIRDILQAVSDAHPGLLLKFGGHKAAAGLSLRLEDVDLFTSAFERAVADALQHQKIGPMLLTDGRWEGELSLTQLTLLKTLEPFGREFDEPLFEADVYIKALRRFGRSYQHLELQVVGDNLGGPCKAIWFNAIEGSELPVAEGQRVHIVFSIPLHQKGKALEIMLRHVV